MSDGAPAEQPGTVNGNVGSRQPRLSDLVLEGVGNARLHFGARGVAVAGDRLLTAGRPAFASLSEADTVGILMTNDAPTVSIFLAALEAGVRLVSLPIPSRTANSDDYLQFVRSVCIAQRVGYLVARDDIAELLSPAGIAVAKHSELAGLHLAAPSTNGFELVQFSSGSTADPKGVQLDDIALGSNVSSIMQTLEPQPGDHSVSWLPLSQDMGLIGMLLTSLASTSPHFVGELDVALLDPVEFLRNPMCWLRALTELRGTITAAPDFGYRMATQRYEQESFDLSTLRCAIIGGEIVRASTLSSFADAFSSVLFRSDSFCPSYGLAEIGLAATITRPEEPWHSWSVDTLALSERRLSPSRESAGSGRIELVASGHAIPGYEVRCNGADDEIGDIAVRGPSIGVNANTQRTLATSEGWLATRDIGVLTGDGLYVVGRGDDHLVANGRNIYAPAVEDAVGSIAGVRAGRAAAIALPTGEWVVVVELDAKRSLSTRERAELLHEVRRAAVRVAVCSPTEIVLAGRGQIAMTPSGKLQRRETLRRFIAGEL